MQLDTLSFHYILLPRHIWLLLFYHTCMVICHIWVLIVSNIITTDIRVHIPHYIALFITHACISSSPEKPSYGTLHKKLCESSRIALPWLASVATRISFALFITAWRTMLRKVWLHGRVYGFLTTRN